MFFDTLCVSFSFVFFPIYCFVAAIYANKDVYTRRGMRVHTFIHSFIHSYSFISTTVDKTQLCHRAEIK